MENQQKPRKPKENQENHRVPGPEEGRPLPVAPLYGVTPSRQSKKSTPPKEQQSSNQEAQGTPQESNNGRSRWTGKEQ